MVFALCLMTHPIVHIRRRRKNYKAHNINIVSEKDRTRENDFKRRKTKLTDIDASDIKQEEVPCLDRTY
jgi:hypothetical protein